MNGVDVGQRASLGHLRQGAAVQWTIPVTRQAWKGIRSEPSAVIWKSSSLERRRRRRPFHHRRSETDLTFRGVEASSKKRTPQRSKEGRGLDRLLFGGGSARRKRRRRRHFDPWSLTSWEKKRGGQTENVERRTRTRKRHGKKGLPFYPTGFNNMRKIRQGNFAMATTCSRYSH